MAPHILKLEARNKEEFDRLAKKLSPGTRLTCIDYFPMHAEGSTHAKGSVHAEGSLVPEAYPLIAVLAFKHNKPFWMLRGYVKDTKKPVTGGYAIDEKGHGVLVKAISLKTDRKLLSIIDAQPGRKLKELTAIVADLIVDYKSELQVERIDALYQEPLPAGRLIGQSIECGKIVSRPVHLITWNVDASGKYKIVGVHKYL